jgi:hypothetical protein
MLVKMTGSDIGNVLLYAPGCTKSLGCSSFGPWKGSCFVVRQNPKKCDDVAVGQSSTFRERREMRNLGIMLHMLILRVHTRHTSYFPYPARRDFAICA